MLIHHRHTAGKEAFQLVFSPKFPLFFLAGGLILAVMGSLLTGILTSAYVDIPHVTAAFKIRHLWLLFGWSTLGLIVVYVTAYTSQAIRKRKIDTAQISDVEKTPALKRRGLILLVSQKATCLKAIEYHSPEYCWLVHSSETDSIAEDIKTEYSSKCSGFIQKVLVEDIHDPINIRDKVNAIYTHLPADLDESDVVADYLGMTTNASVGMVLACLSDRRPLEYTLPQFDKDRKPIAPLDPIEIKISWSVVEVVRKD
jgi:hypothetical protein